MKQRQGEDRPHPRQPARLLDLDPTLSMLADLPDGWAAQPETADDDWGRVNAAEG